MIDDDDPSTPRELWIVLGAIVLMATVLFVRTF